MEKSPRELRQEFILSIFDSFYGDKSNKISEDIYNRLLQYEVELAKSEEIQSKKNAESGRKPRSLYIADINGRFLREAEEAKNNYFDFVRLYPNLPKGAMNGYEKAWNKAIAFVMNYRE